MKVTSSNLLAALIVLSLAPSLFAADATDDPANKVNEKPEYKEEKIPLKDVILKLPETGIDGLKTSFSKESIPWWGLILSSSAVLYYYDQDIYEDTAQKGRNWGIGNEDNTHALFEIGPWPVRFPTDTGSTLYFLGDGITHFTIAGSLIGYGYFSENNRSYNTGLQIIHGMGISTVFNQALKRSFGRETPDRQTKDRGAWRPFPSFSDYANNTPKYDAMPCGHVMTATLTFTILIENYPEYAYWLRPVEVTWLTLLGFQMVNNGVHWASDYPLGIAMGYVFGKSAAKLGKKPQKREDETSEKYSWQVYPELRMDMPTAQLIVDF